MTPDTGHNHSESEHLPNYLAVPATIIIICGVIADLMIISTIQKCRKSNSAFNSCVLHWCICDAIFLVLQPTTYNLIFAFDSVIREIECIWSGEITVLIVGNYIFVVALLLEWFCAKYSETFATKIIRYGKFRILATWIIVIILTFYICVKCILPDMYVWNFVIATASLLIYLFVHILWLIKRKTSSHVEDSSNLALILVSCYMMCWFPNYVIIGIMTFKPHDLGAKSYVGTSLIGYLNSVVMFLLLYYRNKDFKSNFKNLCQDETDVENSTENVVDK
ncbi:hypothetical protein MTP99_002599 [Tenebrio molitor]|jgi:hypothetical protein|nr:hypothetical protein MTP99_002599 [Tenebrio molitor]